MRPGEEDLDGPPIHGNTRLEVIWTAIPAIMLVALCAYAYIVLHDIEKAPANGNELHVNVIGAAVHLDLRVPRGRQEVHATQLYVPEGRSVRFDVTAKDVLHDFWVPAWRMKIDAVPGITTHYRITPNNARAPTRSSAPSSAASGHAFMRQTAHVHARSGVRRLARQESQRRRGRRRRRRPAARRASGDGKALFAGSRRRLDRLRRMPHARRRRRVRHDRARTSTRCCKGRTLRSSSSRSWTPTP